VVSPIVDTLASEMLEELQHALAVGDFSRLGSELSLIGQGGTSRDMALAYEDRNFLIRAMHRQMGLEDRGEAGAAQIIHRFRRYEVNSWKRDRDRADPPADPVACLCWNLLRLNLLDSRRMPSAQSVAAILKKVHCGV